MRKPTRGEVSEILSRLQAYRKEGQRLDGPHAHPFPARMPAALAEFLIQHLTEPSDTVLDPMAGSGTTLVAARRLGRRAIGFDLGSLSVILARAITTTHDPQVLAEAHDRVSQAATKMVAKPCRLLESLWTHFDERERAFLEERRSALRHNGARYSLGLLAPS